MLNTHSCCSVAHCVLPLIFVSGVVNETYVCIVVYGVFVLGCARSIVSQMFLELVVESYSHVDHRNKGGGFV
jgi:hypothetical protein